MGLPGESLATIDLLLNRRAWKRRLREAGVATPTSAVLENAAALRGVLRSSPRVVLKPAEASNGSLGIGFVSLRDSSVDQVFRRAQRHSPCGAVLAEAVCSGPEYSVDGFVQNGRARLLLRSRKFSERRGAGTVPIGYVWGGGPSGDDGVREPLTVARCEALLQEVAAALGLHSTLLSLDVIEADGELQVIDVGAQLDAKMDAVLESLGFDLPGLQLDLALDVPVRPSWPDPEASGALRFFYAEECGRVERVAAVRSQLELGGDVGWLRPVGAEGVPPNSVTEAICWIRVGGASPDEAWQRAARVAPESLFRLRPVPPSSRSEGVPWIRS